MRIILKAIIIVFITFSAIPTWGKMKCTPIYIFGSAISFTDSLVYITDIQILDSAWLDDKNDFLLKRHEYSNQLRSYFTQHGISSRTCHVEFSTSEKKIVKKYERLRKKLNGTKKHPKHYDLREVDEEEFSFSIVQPDVIYDEDTNASISKKAKKRAEKSKDKKSRGSLKNNGRNGKNDGADETPAMPPRH